MVKYRFLLIVFFTTFNSTIAQIRTNNTTSATIGGRSAFLDASANLFTNSQSIGKGIAFPRTNLTLFNFNPNNGNGSNFPTAFDGFIVYNTATGNTPNNGSGIGNQEVTPGFYYFSNPVPGFGSPTSGGEWKPLGSEGSPKIHVTENTPTETNLVTANTASEKVISITGTADGVTTHIDLGTTVLPENTVVNFRKAIICDSTGKQVLVATGSYDTATNKFVTGNGMMNYCLPAATDYKVELYFTSN